MEKIKKIIVDACKKAGLKRVQVQAITAKLCEDSHFKSIYEFWLGVRGIAYGDAMQVMKYLKESEDVYVLDAYAPMYVKIALKSDFPKNPFSEQ